MTHFLHPDVAAWFLRELGEPTPAQEACVPLILERRNVLLSSPTGTGKTLAGFLAVIDRLYREYAAGTLDRLGIRAVYVSPLRALNPHHPTPTGDSWAGGLEKEIPFSLSVSVKKRFPINSVISSVRQRSG